MPILFYVTDMANILVWDVKHVTVMIMWWEKVSNMRKIKHILVQNVVTIPKRPKPCPCLQELTSLEDKGHLGMMMETIRVHIMLFKVSSFQNRRSFMDLEAVERLVVDKMNNVFLQSNICYIRWFLLNCIKFSTTIHFYTSLNKYAKKFGKK